MVESAKGTPVNGLSPPRRPVKAARSRSRSAISNGSRLLLDVDHRGAWARRFRDLIAALVSDAGGIENCSAAQLALVRRAAQLQLQLELLEEHFAFRPGGEAPTRKLETYQRCTNTLRRVLETLGLERRARDITPTLSSILRADLAEPQHDE